MKQCRDPFLYIYFSSCEQISKQSNMIIIRISSLSFPRPWWASTVMCLYISIPRSSMNVYTCREAVELLLLWIGWNDGWFGDLVGSLVQCSTSSVLHTMFIAYALSADYWPYIHPSIHNGTHSYIRTLVDSLIRVYVIICVYLMIAYLLVLNDGRERSAKM